jgi:Ca2+ transporting ATPase
LNSKLLFVFQESRRMMGESPDAAKQFGCSLDELRDLMQHRGPDAYQLLQTNYGGVLELCKHLKTSPNEGEFMQ